MKNQKGITLIALVITIIVLLILAGVSIAMLTGDNGILGQATKAGSNTQVSQAKEVAELDISEQVSAYYEAKYAPKNGTAADTSANQLAYLKTHLATSSDTSLYTLNYSASDGKQITIVPKTNDGKTVKGTIATDGKVTWEEVSE